ncbi:MAG: acyl-CoA synthetase [Ignavibacteria bacterium GWA2_55_11]|nr:MAG: acyl-CoA synthetase [Ignavibacteria bacterium GWA2_55_11]OGU47648.1 MAG: acyl-CoA synthetase [Ignavibacteria bacterium GWC2_56_12]OGU72391.1 MAG: acyl-CoA synthetase [Ignavibacteria bacterium RIFCSPLOWO2_12_FULL_56_21]HAV22313.1 acyl-CoA synthetase [Bacteroidota bacterium]
MSDPEDRAQARLEPIFAPRSVAVVGTTRIPGTVPFDIFQNILKDNFQGTIYPVSPKERSIAGVKAYKYVLDIPDPVDLAVIVFPSSVVNLAMEQCGKKGIKGAIIISAGFREVGPAGVRREEEIKRIAASYGISFIGPNCLGVINTDPSVHLNASFARRMPKEGNIGFMSQSGALCTAVLDYAHAKNIGFSKFISFGNKADVSDIDLMMYLKDDPATKVILVYLEELTDGTRFVRAARRIIRETGKPVLVLKSGRTREGASAAASHTGSLAASDEVVDAALHQAGVIRCQTVEELFNNAIALAYQPLPKGRRVAIVTNAGGPGVLTTDAAIQEKLELARFSESTRETFRKSLPVTANIMNPVDVIGDARADRYRVALGSALDDDNVDGALVILTPQSMTDIDLIAEEVCNVANRSPKPTYTSFMGETDVASGIDILQRRNIPHYILPESMCRAFARANDFLRERDRPEIPPVHFQDVHPAVAQKILSAAAAAGRAYLTQSDAMAVLGAYGLPVLPGRLASSPEDAAVAATQIGFPVAMKVESDDIVHKFDIKGVLLDIVSPEQAKEAYRTIVANAHAAQPRANIRGVFVQQMAGRGEEVILGLKRDEAFGPVLMFGLGGIFVEIFRDVSFRLAPVPADMVRDMMHEVRSYGMLTGARGRTPRDTGALEVCLQRLSQLAVECPQISELDINPLIVRNEGEGCSVADARIHV